MLLGSLPYFFVLAMVGRAVKIPGRLLVAAVAVFLLAVALDHLRRRRRRAP